MEIDWDNGILYWVDERNGFRRIRQGTLAASCGALTAVSTVANVDRATDLTLDQVVNTVEQLAELRSSSYRPRGYYENDTELKAAMCAALGVFLCLETQKGKLEMRRAEHCDRMPNAAACSTRVATNCK